MLDLDFDLKAKICDIGLGHAGVAAQGFHLGTECLALNCTLWLS